MTSSNSYQMKATKARERINKFQALASDSSSSEDPNGYIGCVHFRIIELPTKFPLDQFAYNSRKNKNIICNYFKFQPEIQYIYDLGRVYSRDFTLAIKFFDLLDHHRMLTKEQWREFLGWLGHKIIPFPEDQYQKILLDFHLKTHFHALLTPHFA
jgi:hypothetical protein